MKIAAWLRVHLPRWVPYWVHPFLERLLVTLLIVFIWHYFVIREEPAPKKPAASKKKSPPAESFLNFNELDDLELKETVDDAKEEKKEGESDQEEESTGLPSKKDMMKASEDGAPPKLDNENDNDESREKSSQKKHEADRKTKKEKATSRSDTSQSNTSSSAQITRQESQAPPKFLSNTGEHPGLQALWYWCDTETSLFRDYNLGRTDGEPVIPPYKPQARRGKVQVKLQVTNATYSDVVVYWINYKGLEEQKGTIPYGHTWNQITWIDHPWVFRERETDKVLLHYIPYRVIPTTDAQPTVDPNDPSIGLQRFTIKPPGFGPWTCSIHDPVLPAMAKQVLTNQSDAIAWTLLHCQRMDYSGWNTLKKYLSKIVQQPEEVKYRQIRQANPNFFNNVWNTPARGLLLAVGFVEHEGFVELGTSQRLSRQRVQDISQLLFQVEFWHDYYGGNTGEQPLGADGYGRPGFGRAGAIGQRR